MNWEYKTIRMDAAGVWLSQGQVDEVKLENILNQLGSQGWELIAAFDTNRGGGGTRDVVAILKRPAT